MTKQYYKFCCPNCGSDSFIKIQHLELSTHYYNPPYNYNIFEPINGNWPWSSETTTEEDETDIPSFYCDYCNYHLGNFPHMEDFIKEGAKSNYIKKYTYEPKKNDK